MDSRYFDGALTYSYEKIKRKIMITYKNEPKYKSLITSKNRYFCQLEMSKSEWTTKTQNHAF